jgi:hypothetical protein
MKKFNLKTAIKITPVKAFSFISSQEIKQFELLGFHVKVDDERNDTYYAELITDCQVALEGVLNDLNREGLSADFEISGKYLDQSEMVDMVLTDMSI